MATKVWLVSTSADWFTASDWGGGTLPGAGDTALIGQGGAFYTVTISGSVSVGSILLNSPTALLTDNASLQLNGGTLLIGAGTFNLGGAVSNGTINLAGGTLTSTTGGTLNGVTLEGSLALNLNSGAISTNSLALIGPSGAGGGTLFMQSGQLGFSASQTLSAGTIELSGNSSYAADLNAGTGTTLTLGPAFQLQHVGSNSVLTGNIRNQGTISAAAPGGTLSISGGTLTNLGLLSINGNDDVLALGSLSNSGTIQIGSGGTLSLSGAWSNTGSIVGTGGTILLGGAVTAGALRGLAGTGAGLVLAGALNNSGGTLQVGTGTSLGTLTLQGILSGGTVQDAGGGIALAGGTLDGVTYVGTLVVPQSASGSGGGGSFVDGLTLAAGGVVDILGTLTAANSETIASGTIAIGSTLSAAQGAAPELTTAAGSACILTLGPQVLVQQSGSIAELGGNIVNQGTIQAFFPGGQLQLAAGGTLTNQAVLAVGTGETLDVLGSLYNAGRVLLMPGGTLLLNGGLSGPGTITANGGTVVVAGSIATAGLLPLLQTGAASVVIEGTLNNSGTILQTGSGASFGSLDVQGTVKGGVVQDSGGGLILDGGTLDGVTYQGTLDVPAGPFAGANLLRNGFTLTGAGGSGGGLLNLGGTLSFASPSTLTAGTIALGGGGLASHAPSLYANTLAFGPQALVELVGSQGTIGGSILNQGTIAAVPGSGALVLPGPSTLINAGLVTIATGGTLVAGSVFSNSGTLALASGSTLELSSGSFSSTGRVVASGATVLASGLITGAEVQPFAGLGATVILAGTLNNAAGTLAFGQGAALGTAVLQGTIRGGVVQDPGGGLVLAGGTLDGVTYQGTLDVAPGSSGQTAVDTISDGLTLQGVGGAGAGFVDLAGTLSFANSTTVAGGTILLDSNGSQYPTYFFPELTTAQGVTLTIGPQANIRQTGSLGALGGYLINQGTISATPSGADLQLLAGASLANQGLLTVGNGQTLDIEGSLSNAGTLSVAAGGTLLVAGSWSNTGLIQSAGGTVVLEGAVTNSELQSFAGSGAALVLAGALNNTGGTLQFSGGALPALTLSQGGAISGGVVSSQAQALIEAGGTLSGVTYQGTLDLSAAAANLTLTNGLSMTGAGGTGQGKILLTGTGASLAIQGSQTLNGAALMLGAGLTVTTGTLTLGPLMSVQQSGPNGAISGAVVNQGSISANLNGGSLAISSLANQGSLGVANGDVVSIGSLANSGTISVSGNAVLNLGSQAGGSGLSNTGQISETGATLNLYGALGLATLQSITRSGGLITIGGTLAASGGTLSVGAGSALGTLRLTGTVAGGTILDQGGGMQFYGSSTGAGGGSFQAVTYRGSIDLSPAFSTLTVSGGLTVTGTAGTGAGTINLSGADSQLAFAGGQVFNSATIYIGNTSGLDTLSLRDPSGAGSVLTLGPSTDIEQRGALAAITADRGLGDGIVNQGTIRAAVAGGNFSIYGGSFTNQGSLDATNGATLAVDPDSFSNLMAGTLSGGIYEADAGSTLFAESAGPLVTDNADIILSGLGSRLLSIDPTHLQPLALESTLGTIGAGGTLALLAGRGFAAASALADNGQVVLGAGVLQAPALAIGSGGALQGSGTIAAQISDFGTINASGGALTLQGSIAGTGTLAISAGATLLAAGAIGSGVQAGFSSTSSGELALASPGACSATIQGFGSADLIDLLGVSATGLTYAATGARSGVLTVSGVGGTVAQLQFTGSYSTGNFALASDGQGGTLIKDPPVPITTATLGGPSSMSFLTGSSSRITGQVGTAANGLPQQPGISGYAAIQDFSSLSAEGAVWAALEAALTSRGGFGWPGLVLDPSGGPGIAGAGLPPHSGGG